MKTMLNDTDPQVKEAIALLTEWRRQQFLAAINKVAQDWADTYASENIGGDIGVCEVSAFLNSRHVHYPECWGPDHPHYQKKEYT